DNAIKHTPKAGAVNVTVSNKGNFATLEVQDTGSGFNEQYRDSMFDKFWQGPGSRKYAASVGLGLYLCKQVTDAHNGQITCLSAPNSGA
ncbi:ATP-binding protein, partial [Acinetobacter baumannii]